MTTLNHRYFQVVLCIAMLLGLFLGSSGLSAASLPKPTDRWMKSSGSVLGNLPATAVPETINNELPDGNPTVQVGDVIVGSDGTKMTITQSSERALIDWNSFNIGSNNSVYFNQPGEDSVALNRIFQESPSKIFGNLDATGSVWLFNPNGIFFGRDSEVNVRGLIASTLEFNGLDPSNFASVDMFGAINDGNPFLTNARLLAEGSSYCAGADCVIELNSNPGSEFCSGNSCNDSVAQALIQTGVASTCTGADCRQLLPRIILQDGAAINTIDGGPVLLAAPEVINEGSITAGSGGQVVLAGSKQDVYLAVTSEEDSDLRGFIVEVDSGASTEGGATVNAGDITANLGNITLVAKEIVQAGQLKSTTAVDVNGSIRLLARDGGSVAKQVPSAGKTFALAAHADSLYLDDLNELPDTAYYPIGENPGTVIMQPGSSAAIDIDSSAKTANSSLPQSRSKVHIEGSQVYMAKGAEIIAPSAELTVRARINPLADLSLQELDESAVFIMDDEAKIDVSGTTDAILPVERNTLEFFLTSNEFKDAPQQKGGALLRETVIVDIRKGTPLFDWQSGLAAVEKTAAERSVSGGSIDIRAGALELGGNALLDVSGGYLTYEEGIIESSWLMAGNQLIDLADASPYSPYSGLLVTDSNVIIDPKWGERPNIRPLSGGGSYFRESYQQGGAAGYLYTQAVKQFFNPSTEFRAEALIGPYQRTSTLSPAAGVISLNTGLGLTDVYIANTLGDFGDELVSDNILLLAEQIEESNAGKWSIRTGGVITAGTDQSPVQLTLDGSHSERTGFELPNYEEELETTDFYLQGAGISITGDIRAPGTDIKFDLASSLSTSDKVGTLYLDGVIDTSGNWTNDSNITGTPDLSRFVSTDAGNISLSGANIVLSDKTGFFANAGGWLSQDSELIIGSAADISLTGSNPQFNLESVAFSAIDAGAGGTLTLQSRNVTIGGDVSSFITSEELVLGNQFFTQSAVGGFSLIANGGNATVLGSADIDLFHQNFLALPVDTEALGLGSLASADSLTDILEVTTFRGDDNYLSTPGSLALSALRLSDLSTDSLNGILTLESGSRISGPAKSTLELVSNNRLLINGEIDLPGGQLDARLEQVAGFSNNAGAFGYLMIGEQADIDLSAVAYPVKSSVPGASPLLVEAGEVNLLAVVGSVLVAEGADIHLAGLFTHTPDYFGTAGGANLSSLSLPAAGTEELDVYLGAGSFVLEAEKGFVLNSAIDFGAETEGHKGGNLSLTLNYDTGRTDTGGSGVGPLEVILGSDDIVSTFSGFSFGEANTISGQGFIATEVLQNSYLDTLSVDVSNSRCCAPVSTALSKITLHNDASVEAVSGIYLDTTWLDLNNFDLSLASPYVLLGETNTSSIQVPLKQQIPDTGSGLESGSGDFNVNAQFIDLVGNLALTGADQSTLSASYGVQTRSVIQFDELASQVDDNGWTSFNQLTINTPVIWASTLSDYQFTLLDNGQININPFVEPVTGLIVENSEPILSYGGQLGFTADAVNVNSRIQVPFGHINLTADESLFLGNNSTLSVAAVDETYIPFGRTQGEDLFWIYTLTTTSAPLQFTTQVLNDENPLPEKLISLNAPEIIASEGSQQDLSGGGNVFASEFVAGLGGVKDILNGQSFKDSFVIVKNLNAGFAAYDFVEYRDDNVPWGTTFEVAGSSQLEDGQYTVLPASYAFLEDAYLVRPGAESDIVAEGYRIENVYGAETVSGRFNNASASNSVSWTQFTIEPGFVIQDDNSVSDDRATYLAANLDDFFSGAAPGVFLADNGRMQIEVNGGVGDPLTLDFLGTVLSAENSSIGTSVDITSNQAIQISHTPAASGLTVNPELISGTGADSILIGGNRSWSNDLQAWEIDTTTTDLSVSGVDLSSIELILSATSSIHLSDSSLDSQGGESFAGNNWLFDSDAITLMNSVSSESRFLFNNDITSPGSLNLSNSTIESAGAFGLVYDGASNLQNITALNSAIQIAAGNLTVGQPGVSSVDASLLQQASKIELFAKDALSFDGDLSINNINQVSFTTNDLILADSVDVAITASDSIFLKGINSSISPVFSSNNSSLQLTAPRVFLGAGSVVSEQEKAYLNVDVAELHIAASNQLVAADDLAVKTAGDVNIITPELASNEGKAEFSLSAAGDLIVESLGQFAETVNRAPAAIFRLFGDSVKLDTRISAQSGIIEATARNGDLVVGSNSQLDVSSYRVEFRDKILSAPAGIISLNAANDLHISTPSAFDFGTGQQSGEGGFLNLYAGDSVLFSSLDTVGAWSSGGVNLSIQSDLLDLSAITLLNANGFDGDLNLMGTASGASVNLDNSVNWTAENMTLAMVGGFLTLGNGSVINITNASKDAILFGGQGVNVEDGAEITLASLDPSSYNLALQSPNGMVDVDAGAAFTLDGGLEIVQSVSSGFGDITIDNADTLGGDIELFLAKTYSDTSLSQSDVNSFFSDISSAIGATSAGDLITTGYSTVLKPLVDIVANGAMTVTDAIDMLSLRFNGNPGRVQLRATGDIGISQGISDGVRTFSAPPFPATTVLDDGDSWDLALVAGADITHGFGLTVPDFISGSGADLNISDGAYLRTGTGDISVATSGDINLGSSAGDRAYIVTYGRADHVLDSFYGQQLPTSGNGQGYIELFLAVNGFSGFSLESGDIHLDVGGSLNGFSADSQTPASFIRSLASDDLSLGAPFFFDYSGRRVRALAIDGIDTGIHSVAGGNLSIHVEGDAQYLAASTPGLALGEGLNELQLEAGGRLDIQVGGDLVAGSFANDGASVNVRSFGDIRSADAGLGEMVATFAGEDIDPSLFLMGSFTEFNITAGGDLTFDGITNPTILPVSDGQELAFPIFGGLFEKEELAGIYYAGYDQTSLRLGSINGDITYTVSPENSAAVLGTDMSNNLSSMTTESRFRVLPSSVEFLALNGGITINDSVTLFPSADASLNLKAVEKISTNNEFLENFFFYLPDFDSNVLPTSDNFFEIKDSDFNNPTFSNFRNIIDPSGLRNLTIAQTSLLDRSASQGSSIHVLEGDLGGDDSLVFYLPMAVDVFAGRDIRNTSFEIQHASAGDISKIRADRDIIYDIELQGQGVRDTSNEQFIRVAGPGDLIVSAGNDIELAAGRGIVSVGNASNPLLDDSGASLHIYAGFKENRGDLNRLIGEGVSGNQGLAYLKAAGLSDSETESLSLSDWFSLLAEDTAGTYDTVILDAVSKATGVSYDKSSVALSDWSSLSESLKLRIATFAIKEIALSRPELLVENGNLLFGKKPLGVEGFSTQEQRSEAFEKYWNEISSLIVFNSLLTPERIDSFSELLPQGMDLDQLSGLSVSEQLNLGVSAFESLSANEKLLVGEQVVNHKVRQSGIEAFEAGKTLVSFERGFVALRRFFGDNFDAALAGARDRINTILAGEDISIKPDELNFGLAGSQQLSSFSEVLDRWALDSGDSFDFDPEGESKGSVNLVFSAIRTQAPGADINFLLPSGGVDVGVSADLVKSLGVKLVNGEVNTGELGVIAEFYGDINAVVASGFNVNESRAFSLAGGALNLWSSWGDIDAGKGAKTAVTTPEARFVVSQTTGAVSKINPPAVSGSGIKTEERRLASSNSLSEEERFYLVASGAGPAYLATPLGVVDAGEAGIESAGDLFIAAQQVRGADNISVGGVSVGIATSTPVGASFAGVGDAANQATDSVTDSVSGAAARDAASNSTAFVSIELLDTGIGFGSE